MINVAGKFNIEIYDTNGKLKTSFVSNNMVSNEFVELVESKLFRQVSISGYNDTRQINKFIVGSSDSTESPNTKFDDIYNSSLRNEIRPVSQNTEDVVGDYLMSTEPINWESNYAQTKRVMTINFASPSGFHIGNWKELGLVMTGVSGEDNLLFCRTTGFDFFKDGSESIVGEYNIVF
jgi:hypothetical protein